MVIEPTQAVRITTVVTEEGVLSLRGPFHAGDTVEIIVLNAAPNLDKGERYPLRSTSYSFTDPFASVETEEWMAAL